MRLSALSAAMTRPHQPFIPSSLFFGSQQGAWSAPRDFSTRYQGGTTGATPVTAVEQAIGLLLEKSEGVVRGPELVTNGNGGTFATDIAGVTATASTISRDTTVFPDGGLKTVSTVAGAGPCGAPIQTFTAVVGNFYEIKARAYAPSSNVVARCAAITMRADGGVAADGAQVTAEDVVQDLSFIFKATATSHTVYGWLLDRQVEWGQIGDTAYFDNVSVREVPGNHATQATADSRPVLSARVNALLATEDFTSANWSKVLGCTATANVITFNTTAGNRVEQSTSQVSVAGQQWVYSIELSGSGTINLTLGDSTGVGGQTEDTITLTPTPTRYTVNWTVGAGPTGNVRAMVIWRDGNTAVNVTAGKSDVRRLADAALNIPAYQRVNTDYDTVGFPHGDKFDGVDDSMSSATGGGGTAGFFWCGAVKVLGGAGTFRNIWSDDGGLSGYRVRINTSNQLEIVAGNGAAYTTVATASTLSVGATHLVTLWDDGTNLNVQLDNGAIASVARPVITAGTAGFTIGKDNGAASGFFNGVMFDWIYRKDSAPTLAEIARAQRHVARTAGVTL